MSDASVIGRGGTARRWVRGLVQVAGFALCLALLGWCVSVAFSGENLQRMSKLRGADPGLVALLLGLSGASLLVNGATFWAVIRPVRRVPFADVQAVNAVASLLSNLPFKLSVIFRVLVHNRRNRVPVLTIAAWMGASAAVMLAVLLPAAAASVWRGRLDAVWLGVAAGGVGALTLAMLGAAIFFSRGAGWRMIERLADESRQHRLARAARSRWVAELHEGVRMLASPGAVLGAVALRVIDLGLQAGRFMVAAAILDHPLTAGEAVLAAAAFFFIEGAAPTGSLGVSEAGAIGVLGQAAAPVVVVVKGSDTIVRLLGSAIGLAWLRPDRLMRGDVPLTGDATPITPTTPGQLPRSS